MIKSSFLIKKLIIKKINKCRKKLNKKVFISHTNLILNSEDSEEVNDITMMFILFFLWATLRPGLKESSKSFGICMY